MGICGEQGTTLKQKWSDGLKTSHGMTAAGFPNLFFPYGPQAPSSFCSGSVCAELQGDWMVDIMKYMRSNGLRSVEPSKESEQQWAAEVSALANASLLPTAKSVRCDTAWSDVVG